MPRELIDMSAFGFDLMPVPVFMGGWFMVMDERPPAGPPLSPVLLAEGWRTSVPKASKAVELGDVEVIPLPIGTCEKPTEAEGADFAANGSMSFMVVLAGAEE